ncbi:toxin-antitoxin system HicB family antitoxin [Limnohabitans planktonicus]|uniref:Toxin-antitoxin system HicB family antitoxin n=1 Tax=Limnohabitans planktonicus II-D5 TaxID=1293045 RepID=A0A2T7UHJ4_9BURK|nr:toxin-antitoxin system HicB family antitoxin [Limnohabitans planktonicus]PVE44160.1 hypothetical protein H663_004220 [Limnohabitans planktonicus II-D5]
MHFELLNLCEQEQQRHLRGKAFGTNHLFEPFLQIIRPQRAPASASGKVLARLPRSMHLQLTARAKTEGVSLNSLVLAFIAEGLGRRAEVRT